MWDIQIQTTKMVMANQLHIVVDDKQEKVAVAVDVAVPLDSNISKKEHEKLKKYQGPKEELERLRGIKVAVVPEMIGATEAGHSKQIYKICQHIDIKICYNRQ